MATGFLNSKRMPMRAHENILVFYQQLPTYNPQFTKGKPYKCAPRTFSANYANQRPTIQESDGRRYPRDCIFYGTVQCLHPQQKPVDLLEYMIKTYTNEGEVVLDATMGSGSTGVAAINTGRKFIGFELDEKYFETARKRIEAASSGLF